jgi:hypothetical protein
MYPGCADADDADIKIFGACLAASTIGVARLTFGREGAKHRGRRVLRPVIIEGCGSCVRDRRSTAVRPESRDKVCAGLSRRFCRIW